MIKVVYRSSISTESMVVDKYIWPKYMIDDSADMEMLLNTLIESDDEHMKQHMSNSRGRKIEN